MPEYPVRCAVCGAQLSAQHKYFYWYPMCDHDRDEAAGLYDWIRAQTYGHTRTKEEEERLAQDIVAILILEEANKK